MKSNLHANKQVPADFPRPCGGSVSGAQNKLSARKIGGRFVGGMTEDELWVRYDACQDLSMKLVELAEAKRDQYAKLSQREFLRRLRAGVVKRGWNLAAEELDWVMLRVTMALGGGAVDAPGRELAVVLPMREPAVQPHVPTLVDVALGRIGVGPGSERD